MGWMHDMLEYFSLDPVHRAYHHRNLTFALLYAFSERFMLPLSHDEVVHGKRSLLDKMPGDLWQKFANLRALFGLMFAFPGKKLLFMGGELGQWVEWNHESSLDWHLLEYESHQGVQRLIDSLHSLYSSEGALHEVDFEYRGFEWIDFQDAANSVIAFERKAKDPRNRIVVVCNFTPVPRNGYRVGVSYPGKYRELVNTDSQYFGGSNLGNSGEIEAENMPFHHHPYSLSLTLPPLAVLYLKLKNQAE
jgi:1,4-alpha-glucan branching enzyme